MHLSNNNYSTAEIIAMLERKELQINRDYQRGSRLWPSGARSYFIETILEKFPFPKIYFYEVYDRIQGQPRRELVDGQQRVFTIQDFRKDVFAISGESRFKGLKFSDLDEEQTADFMSYTVSVDVIRNATRAEILQMFRRMNAYTLPLNAAEKRHSTFQGNFKWFVNDISKELSEFFSKFGVFTDRQVIRMADAELISEIVLSMENGIISTKPADLNYLYKGYDNTVPIPDIDFHERIVEAVREITSFQSLENSYLMKPYALHMLVVAIMHLKCHIPALAKQLVLQYPDRLGIIGPRTEDRLIALAQAHEAKESEGPYSEYVWGCQAGTNRAGRRLARLKGVLAALGNPVDAVLDENLADLLP